MKQTVFWCLVYCLLINIGIHLGTVQCAQAQLTTEAAKPSVVAPLATITTPTHPMGERESVTTPSAMAPATHPVSEAAAPEHGEASAVTPAKAAVTHMETPTHAIEAKTIEHLITPTKPLTPTPKPTTPEHPIVHKEETKKAEIPAAPVEKEPTAQEQEKAAKQEVAKVLAKPAPTFEEEGIDTYEQEGGNWLLKRQALEKTMDVIEKIKDVFTKILESRIDYLVKRNKIDRTFDLFSNKIGFELGDLNKLLTTLVQDLKGQRKEEGDLTEEERQVLAAIETKITELKNLRTTVRSITDLDASLDDTIMQLEKEIDTSNSYQTRAWKNFQTIKKVLSDEKAEELYLQTESLLKNMQEILRYLKGDLSTYFNSIINNLRQSMDKVEASIKDLDAKGINLLAEVKKIKKAEKLARKKRRQEQMGIKAETEAEKKEAAAKKAAAAVKTSGWYDYVSMIWTYPLSIITSTWDYVMSFFVTKKVEPKKLTPTEAEQEKVQQEKTKKELEAQEVKKK